MACGAGDLRSTDLLDVFVERIEKFDPELNAFCYLDLDGARARAVGDRRGGRARRGSRRLGGRADGREGAGRGRGLARHARLEGVRGRHRGARRHRSRAAAGRGRGVRRPHHRRRSSARSTGRGRRCTARRAIRGIPSARPAGRRAARPPRSSVGMMPICTGSDGGGSIRIPSSYCGLFGFKMSFGRVGSDGAFDNALTSVPGPMCRSVRDAARYVDAIAGPTAIDPTSLPRPVRAYEDTIVSGDAQGATARPEGRVVVDARLRGLRSRGREARVRGRARRCARTRASSSSTSTCSCRVPVGRGRSSPRHSRRRPRTGRARVRAPGPAHACVATGLRRTARHAIDRTAAAFAAPARRTPRRDRRASSTTSICS